MECRWMEPFIINVENIITCSDPTDTKNDTCVSPLRIYAQQLQSIDYLNVPTQQPTKPA